MADAELDAVLAKAKELRAADQYQEAIDLLTETIQTSPSPNARLYFSRGRALDMCDRDEEAVADYTRAIELDPTIPAYYLHRGYALTFPLGRDDAAVDDFKKVLEFEPDNVNAHRACCLCYLMIGPLRLALEHAQEAVRLVPDDALTHFCLGESQIGLKRYGEAVESFERAVELDPEAAHYWSALGRAHKRLAEIAPNMPNHPAYPPIIVAKDQLESAVAAYTRAIQLDSGCVSYFLSRGDLRLELGMQNDAIADLRHALTLNPDDVNRMLINSSLERAIEASQ